MVGLEDLGTGLQLPLQRMQPLFQGATAPRAQQCGVSHIIPADDSDHEAQHERRADGQANELRLSIGSDRTSIPSLWTSL